MLNELHEENAFQKYSINPNKYTSEKVYKIIKKFNIPLINLTKDSILYLIFNYDSNNQMLKNQIKLLNKNDEKCANTNNKFDKEVENSKDLNDEKCQIKRQITFSNVKGIKK